MPHPLLIVPLMIAAAPLSLAPSTGDRARCPKPATAADKAQFRRLTDLPGAEAFKAVLRSGDCPATVIQARDRIGPVPRPRRY